MQAVGVSNYGPKQLQKIHQYLTERRGVPLASAQARRCPQQIVSALEIPAQVYS